MTEAVKQTLDGICQAHSSRCRPISAPESKHSATAKRETRGMQGVALCYRGIIRKSPNLCKELLSVLFELALNWRL